MLASGSERRGIRQVCHRPQDEMTVQKACGENTLIIRHFQDPKKDLEEE